MREVVIKIVQPTSLIYVYILAEYHANYIPIQRKHVNVLFNPTFDNRLRSATLLSDIDIEIREIRRNCFCGEKKKCPNCLLVIFFRS